MIENLQPSDDLLGMAPMLTAIVFTGEDQITFSDLALGVETGEVIPLSDPAFQPLSDPALSDRRMDVATLLGCSAMASVLAEVADAVLLHTTQLLGTRKSASSCQPAASSIPTISPSGPMDGSFQALLIAMDATQTARFGTPCHDATE